MATPELRPLGEALGTEALGIDLAKLDDAAFAWIQQGFAEHPVLVFRNQHLDADGNIDWYGVKRATDWHTDSTYEEVPPLLAMLYALEVPASKGGTMFADMRAAYDALPQTMK